MGLHSFFRDYFWQTGIPRGRGRLTDEEASRQAFAYKIVDDPYRKRFCIERYQGPRFERVIYDSNLLDFRRLKPVEQQGWQREVVRQTADEIVSLIRNQEERALYLEHMRFEGSRCRQCQLTTTQGVALSLHIMFYTALNDSFNGILFYDTHDHLVLAKRYAVGPTGEFTELLEERWDQDDSSFLSRWQTEPLRAPADGV